MTGFHIAGNECANGDKCCKGNNGNLMLRELLDEEWCEGE